MHNKLKENLGNEIKYTEILARIEQVEHGPQAMHGQLGVSITLHLGRVQDAVAVGSKVLPLLCSN